MRALFVLALVTLGCASGKARSANDAQTIETAVGQWKAVRMGDTSCPTLTDLRKDKLVPDDLPSNDSWGHPYQIVCTDLDYSVRSAGPDGIPGNADDVVTKTK